VSERFAVRVASPKLHFNAAHFVAFGPDDCEPIHGHDFHVSALVEGRLSPTGWVIDFHVLEGGLAKVIRDFDHALLLPESSPWVNVAKDGPFLEIAAGRRFWRFPAGDCRLLPIPNVTAELLAQHIGLCFRKELLAQFGDQAGNLDAVTVELSESEGCSASWRMTFDQV